MIFLPSQCIAERLRSEPGGVWIDPSKNEYKFWLVAKIQTYLIREIDAGASIVFNVWVINSEGGRFAAFGLSVVDDSIHPKMIYGACRSTEEIENLRNFVELNTVPIQFHNENELPLLNATCTFDPEQVAELAAALPTGDYPQGDGVLLRRKALDILQGSMAINAELEPRIEVHCAIPLSFVRKERTTATVIGIGEFTLENADQGRELEQLTFQLIDALFPYGTFHSPQRVHGNGKREVCDVLAFSRIRQVKEEGLFVIQNKVAFTDGRRRTTERRGLTIQGNILSGLGQAVGAVKKLKENIQIYRHDGVKIEDDPPDVSEVVEPVDIHTRANEIGHGIVLVSDLHEGVDWELVWGKLVTACKQTGYFYHVLDLQELHGLIVNANEQPAIFESYLVERWRRMEMQKNALVRFRFIV